MQYEKVKGFFADIEKEGLKVATGGTNPDGPGYFITPTIIDRPDAGSRIVTEEPFGTPFPSPSIFTVNIISGPILPLLSYATYDEAIALANNTNYGLGASVWSSNIPLANEIAQQLEAGSVWVNTHFELDPRVPFGGHKGSGVGVELGLEGLKGFCNVKTMYLRKGKL